VSSDATRGFYNGARRFIVSVRSIAIGANKLECVLAKGFGNQFARDLAVRNRFMQQCCYCRLVSVCPKRDYA